ncbi:MAG TPA: prolyl oligopeptidase family serine peptidase [Polyangiaceae bacterium]|nr:prolyl oligopeptidase family serine peptidase [Polyangiaceae bacterium]
MTPPTISRIPAPKLRALALSALVTSVAASCGSAGPDLTVAPVRRASSQTADEETSHLSEAKKALPYPDNHPGDAVDVHFGTKVADPYRWLEDEKSPEVKTWLEAQDKLGRGELAKLPERDAIEKRLKELVYIDSLSAPVKRKNRYFYSRRHADKEKGIVYVRDGKAGKERVLFDPNTWSTDGSVSLGTWTPSYDGKKVAYAVHKNNSDEATLYVLDVDTMKKSDVDVIEGAKYAYPSWTPQNDAFYYTWLPTDPAIKPADRPGFAEVRFHKLGQDPKKDKLVHEKTGDASKFISADLSRDGKFLFLTVSDGWTSDALFLKDGTKVEGKFAPVAAPGKAHYQATSHAGSIFIVTDEGAPHWHVFKVDPAKTDRSAWVEIVKEDPSATIDGFAIIGGKLAVRYLDKASSKMSVFDLGGKKLYDVALPGIGTVSGPIGDPTDDEAYFGFQSFTTPLEIHELAVPTGKTSLYSKVEVPIDPSKFTTEQVTYKSKDGTPVTMFIVKPKDAPKDGNNRVYLYGYGGFQVSLTPELWATYYPWLERGGILAIPNLRGGGEYGEAWHQAGMKLVKQNVFDDFIGAAEYLVKEKYTRPERMVIAGASNGGLLVGATMTQRPDLFAGVVCGVPLLDMIRYTEFGSGRTWISEYGSADDEAEFKALYAYSPYHHVKKGTKYPALLMLTADSDDRVDPMHARKFAAAIEDASTGGPVYVRMEKNAGHAGADLRKSEVEKGVDRLAFALSVTEGR